MREISLPHKWSPRVYQKPAWDALNAGIKRAVFAWHRRSGKDDIVLNHTSCSAFERVGNYWYCLPEYSQARKSMWDAVNPNTGHRRIDDIFPQELRKTTRENEMMIVFQNGSTFQLVGSDNHDSLIGSPPVGIAFSEFAVANPSSWAYLQPIVEENNGWAVFNSTPRGHNHFESMCKYAQRENDWFFQKLTNDDTRVFTDKQLADILANLQAIHGEAYGRSLYLQEYFTSFDAAIPGSIWGEAIDALEQSGRISSPPYAPLFPVYTGWDLGRTDDTVIWFYQVIGGEIRVIDYHASNLKDVDFYAEVLDKKRDDRGFVYGTHWLPHDARPRTLAAGGKSILQQLEDYNRKLHGKLGQFAICPRLDREEGIQAARATFRLSWFDAVRCENGIEALKQYHRTWDDEKKVFSSEPVHDWASHPADAWRTVALTWKQAKNEFGKPDTTIQDLLGGSIGAQTFGTLKDTHLSRARRRREDRAV